MLTIETSGPEYQGLMAEAVTNFVELLARQGQRDIEVTVRLHDGELVQGFLTTSARFLDEVLTVDDTANGYQRQISVDNVASLAVSESTY